MKKTSNSLLKLSAVISALLLNGCDSTLSSNRTAEYVDTTTGSFYGLVEDETSIYKGIRYADASKSFRWRDAGKVEDFDTPVIASNFGNICYQAESAPNYLKENMSEDCLSLNVWRPNDANMENKKPVIVWIHGGAFVGGSSANPIYDGKNLSEYNDAIVVSFNYRLGALGYLKIDPNSSGNYGIADQKKAIDWVFNNIEKFGGDSTEVTLMGQSAGSMSVGIHTTNGSEISKKVKNAIMQSPYMGFGFKDEKSAAQIASSLKKDVEDKTSKSIYEADPLSLIYMSLELTKTLIGEHFPTIAFKTLFPYSPYIDNSTIKLDLIKSKTTVPLLIGNNNDEINFMLNSIPPSFIEAIDAFKKEKNPDLSYSEFLNLYAFKCSTRYFTQSNGDNSYFYHNSFVPSFAFFANKECQYPAICHGSELPFVFNNFYEQNGTKVTPTDADKLFSHNIMSKWGEFSKSSYITGFQKYSPDGSMIYIDNNIPNFYNVGDILKDKCSSFNDYY